MGGACASAVGTQRLFMLPMWVESGIFGLLGGAQSAPAEHMPTQQGTACRCTRETSDCPGRSPRTLDRYRVAGEGPRWL